jgi:hypothetical protein
MASLSILSTGNLFPFQVAKRPEYGTAHSIPSSAEVRKGWSFRPTFTVQYVIVVLRPKKQHGLAFIFMILASACLLHIHITPNLRPAVYEHIAEVCYFVQAYVNL